MVCNSARILKPPQNLVAFSPTDKKLGAKKPGTLNAKNKTITHHEKSVSIERSLSVQNINRLMHTNTSHLSQMDLAPF